MKKVFFKRQLGLVLVLSLMLSMTTACQKQDTDKKETVATQQPADVASDEELGKMRDITSQELLDEMTIGWNLGDTLDVCNADRDGDGQVNENAEVVDETLWGNVKTTKELFTNLKKEGINAVRIPVTWRDHTGKAPDYKIDEDWMNRVQEVVDYAYSQEMYVIINVHHDGGGDPDFGAWIRNASNQDEKEKVFDRFKAIWTQIAERFNSYSDYLIFESMNEVGFDDLGEEDAFALLTELNQAFVDVVRASKGNNPMRHLLISGYWTDIESCCKSVFKMPKDTVENRMILSVHYYTPWEFCTTNMQNTWGTEADLELMHSKIDMLEENFVKKGVPVIIGEYGFGRNETASCVYFAENLAKYSHEKKIPTFLWDNKQMYNRETMKWNVEGLGEALKRAVSEKDYEVTKNKSLN